jgi:WD40 repeat protein
LLFIADINAKVKVYKLPEYSLIREINTSPYYVMKIIKAKENNKYFFGMRNLNTNANNKNLDVGNIHIYDFENNIFFALSTYSEDLTDLIITADSSKIISASSSNEFIRIWDVKKLILESSFKTTLKPSVIFASHTNKMIGVGSADNPDVKIYRITGEEILHLNMDTGYIIYGEINKDITRIHVCNNYGQFKKYDFHLNLREIIGYYANLNDKISCYAYDKKKKIIYLGYQDGMLLSFDLLKSELKTIFKTSETIAQEIIIDENGENLLILYKPQYKENSTSYLPDVVSKVAVYNLQKEQFIFNKEYHEKYLTSFYFSEGKLFLGFNTGLLEIIDFEKNKLLSSYNVVPFDIVRIINNNNLLAIQSLDDKLNIFQLNTNYTLKLIKTINLEKKENLTDLKKDFLLTNYRVYYLNGDNQIKFKSFIAKVYKNDTILTLDTNELKLTKNEKLIWNNKILNLGDVIGIVQDTLFSFAAIISPYSKLYFVDLNSGKPLGELYIENNDTWLFMQNLIFDASENIISKIKVVKGTAYSSNLKVENLRKQKLIPKVLKLEIN